MDYLLPDWSAPKNIRAFSTLRHFGNFSSRLGSPEVVLAERTRLLTLLQVPHSPVWINQVHGVRVLDLDKPITSVECDAVVTRQAGTLALVMHADCLPVLACDKEGKWVAAIHAGWRSLCHGVIEATLHYLQIDPENTLIWLGPAIGPLAFEVGPEVVEAFVAQDSKAASAFVPGKPQKWMGDLKKIARQRLSNLGIPIHNIISTPYCTYNEPERFYSFRRNPSDGRMVSGIYKVGA